MYRLIYLADSCRDGESMQHTNVKLFHSYDVQIWSQWIHRNSYSIKSWLKLLGTRKNVQTIFGVVSKTLYLIKIYWKMFKLDSTHLWGKFRTSNEITFIFFLQVMLLQACQGADRRNLTATDPAGPTQLSDPHRERSAYHTNQTTHSAASSYSKRRSGLHRSIYRRYGRSVC